jgi:hypothetical protein
MPKLIEELLQHRLQHEHYEFLYRYARSAVEDERLQLANVEDKASKLNVFLSLVITGYTAVTLAYAEIFFPPDTIYSWFCLLVIGFTYLTLISAWSLLFRALRLIEIPRLQLDDEFIAGFEETDLPTRHYSLSIDCKHALLHWRNSVMQKSALLKKAYDDIVLSFWLMTGSLLLMLIGSYQGSGAPLV